MANVVNKILQFLVPKDTKFIPLLRSSASNLVTVAEKLDTLANSSKKERESLFEKLVELDLESDRITREINLELSRNFLTPFDREDIHALNIAIGDVVDYLNDSANRFQYFKLDEVTKAIKKLTEVNVDACRLIEKGIDCLAGNKKLAHIAVVCKKINELEVRADKIHDKAVAEIFENETDAKTIIKYKEVLFSLETATDKCKVVANVLESVMVKYS
jgi:predicted phosphate transport protein (TIGR00153 family)